MSGKRIVIGGASGMLGNALALALEARGDTVVRLVRSSGATGSGNVVRWDPGSGELDPDEVRGADAVVILNGVPVAKRWTDRNKRAILASRVDSVGTAARAVAGLGSDGPALITASAIGIYGDRGDEVLDESSTYGDDFLAEVCIAWEGAAQPAVEAGVRVASMRTGLVFSDVGGALAPMMPLFKLGLGGKIGDGSQWWSWISKDDVIGGYLTAIDGDLSGPVNLVGPNPVTNAEFTEAFGSALRRPTFMPVPKFGLSLRLGKELAEVIGYGSQRVAPTVLESAGYEFVHPTVDQALTAALG